MSTDEIYSDLKEVLEEDQLNKRDVVFLLSRIRKILETEEGNKFKKLKFYCHWALHIEIWDTRSMEQELQAFIDGERSSHEFVYYTSFHNELRLFLDKHGLNTKIYKSNTDIFNFNSLLTEIYKETPLIVKGVKKQKVVIHGGDYNEVRINDLPVFVTSVGFTVTDID